MECIYLNEDGACMCVYEECYCTSCDKDRRSFCNNYVGGEVVGGYKKLTMEGWRTTGINSKITASGEIGGKKIMFTRDLSNKVLKHFAEVDIEAYLKQTYKKR